VRVCGGASTQVTAASPQVTLDYKLARGAFGNVFKGTWLGTEVAVKQIDVWSLQDLEAFLDEASILAQLHHPNIVQLLGVCDSRNPQGGREMLLVMEFLQQGSLNEVLLDPAVELADARKLQMALDAARGMLYLHTLTPPVLHRDLKSPNLLVDQRFKAPPRPAPRGAARVQGRSARGGGACR
jgi:serine/threonine protein kinase